MRIWNLFEEYQEKGEMVDRRQVLRQDSAMLQRSLQKNCAFARLHYEFDAKEEILEVNNMIKDPTVALS